MDFSFETPNLAQYERMLLAMSTSVARGLGKKALRQGTNVILKETRLLARRRTGLLIKSIYTKDGGVIGPNIIFSVSVRRQAFYAKFVEFGTSHSRAFPFMRPAAESKAEEAVAVLGLVLGQGISDQWGKTS